MQQARKWLFRPKFFSLSKWAQFLHVTLDLTGKRCPVIFSAVLFFVFEKFSSTSTGGKCALRWFYCLEKQKLSLERTPPGKKTAFLHTLFVENERETSKLKWGAMFFYKVEGHMPKLSSFGRAKKFRPKKSLTSLLHAALQLNVTFLCCVTLQTNHVLHKIHDKASDWLEVWNSFFFSYQSRELPIAPQPSREPPGTEFYRKVNIVNYCKNCKY